MRNTSSLSSSFDASCILPFSYYYIVFMCKSLSFISLSKQFHKKKRILKISLIAPPSSCGFHFSLRLYQRWFIHKPCLPVQKVFLIEKQWLSKNLKRKKWFKLKLNLLINLFQKILFNKGGYLFVVTQDKSKKRIVV